MPEAVETTSRERGAAKPSDGQLTRKLLDGLERGGLPLLLIAMFAFFAFNGESGDVFTSSANLDNILANQTVTALVAIAMVVPLSSGYFDLSVSAIAGLSNVAMAATIGTHGWPIWQGMLFALACGALIGFGNGFLVAKLKLNGFIVTLGTFTLLGGLVVLYTEGQTITAGIPASFSQWGAEDWLGIPRPFWLLLIGAILIWYLLSHTPFGRSLESIGSNESAARLVGIDTTRTIWLAFVVSGMLAAAAGVLQTSRAGGGSPEIGNAFLFPALVAVFLGATTIRPGRYNVWGTVIGVYFVAISVSGFTLMGAETWIQPVFNGASLIVAVALATLLARERERRAAIAVASAPAEEPPAGSGDSPNAASER